MEQGRTCQADIFWGIPSSVPCSSYETTGGRIELADALELTRENDVACLGEVMNCYSVLHEPNGKIRTWLECLRREHPALTREGHISYYKGAELCDIAFHGVDSDHTSIGLDYFIERLKMGVFGEIQEKSILPEVVDYVEKNQVWDHFCIVTDDVMPDQLVPPRTSGLPGAQGHWPGHAPRARHHCRHVEPCSAHEILRPGNDCTRPACRPGTGG